MAPRPPRSSTPASARIQYNLCGPVSFAAILVSIDPRVTWADFRDSWRNDQNTMFLVKPRHDGLNGTRHSITGNCP